ncbi:MAG: sulfite exporter TauE/SafE family protein, partial [Mucinivorans sp.]
MDTTIVILLVCSGLLVGVINTFAGAAAAITMALFTALGLPINVANGTNRIPVLAQTLVMSIGFARQG